MGLRNVCVRRLKAHPVNQLSFSVHRATNSIAIMTLRTDWKTFVLSHENKKLHYWVRKPRQSMFGFFFPIIFSMRFSSIHRIADVGWWWLLIFFTGTLNSFIRRTNLCIGEQIVRWQLLLCCSLSYTVLFITIPSWQSTLGWRNIMKRLLMLLIHQEECEHGESRLKRKPQYRPLE